jgi:hypothetical protein
VTCNRQRSPHGGLLTIDATGPGSSSRSWPWTAGVVRDVILALFVAVAISLAGGAWVNYDVPGIWPPWFGPEVD